MNDVFMLFSICIATYRRPLLLKNLLESLKKQILDENFKLQIIIVDNDLNCSAKNIIDEFANNNILNIEYYKQHEKNISLTRNLALEYARGDYILFIDDDEFADKLWIKNIYAATIAFNADGAFGKVVPIYEEGISNWIKESKLFDRNCSRTGQIANAHRTGNCIVKRKLFEKGKYSFDYRYGLTGGEDSYLFHKMTVDGAKFIDACEAIVYEPIEKTRTSLKFIVKKHIRTGNAFSRRVIEFSDNTLVKRSVIGFTSLIVIILSIFISFFTIFQPAYSLRWFAKANSNLGHILGALGIAYKGYK
jgi:succinoglycan biosynthesis protein ExoM